VLSLLSPATFADDISTASAGIGFEPFVAVYRVQYGDIDAGNMTLTLQKLDANSYKLSAVSRSTGIAAWFKSSDVLESSQWYLRNEQVTPFLYNFQDDDRDDERQIQVRFNWSNHQAINSIDGKPWTMEVPPRAQDKLSYIALLMQDLGNGKRDFMYDIADGGKLKTYNFRAETNETIATGVGTLDTIRIKRMRQHRHKRHTLYWCAKKYGYLPVKIEKWKKGKPAYSITLESYRAS
jgi:hypothetical protein